MNYYPFHIGDYASHTAHLEPLEDLAYRRMIDLYYLREDSLPDDIQEIARLIRMKPHTAEIECVLNEFFILADGRWINERADAEIAAMLDKQAKARASAELSVKARQAKAKQKTSEGLTDAQRTLNEPSTNVELPTPTPTPTPIIKPTHTNAHALDGSIGSVEHWKPDKKHLADQLGFRGVAMPSDAGLEQILYAFRAHYETKPMTDKQSMAKLVAWIQREHKPTNPDKPAEKTNRHAGFEDTDYSAGVLPDGRF